jgi:hypothetical protein
MLLDWNFGFTRLRLTSTFDLTSPKGLNDLKIPGTNNVGTTGDPSIYYGLPGFIFPQGLNLGNAQNANPFLFRDGSYVSGANLSWTRGNASLPTNENQQTSTARREAFVQCLQGE